nr:Asp23/Gls24 family envelope stress response protein [Bacillus sp. J33]
MQNKHLDFETIKAASDIISAIVESNLLEWDGVTPAKSDKISFLKKNSNHLSVSFKDTEVYLKIKMNVQKGINIMEETAQIQQEIKDEIIHLTGFKVKRVDVFIEKILPQSAAVEGFDV